MQLRNLNKLRSKSGKTSKREIHRAIKRKKRSKRIRPNQIKINCRIRKKKKDKKVRIKKSRASRQKYKMRPLPI